MSLRMVAVAEWHRKPAFVKNFESVLSLPLHYLTHESCSSNILLMHQIKSF